MGLTLIVLGVGMMVLGRVLRRRARHLALACTLDGTAPEAQRASWRGLEPDGHTVACVHRDE